MKTITRTAVMTALAATLFAGAAHADPHYDRGYREWRGHRWHHAHYRTVPVVAYEEYEDCEPEMAYYVPPRPVYYAPPPRVVYARPIYPAPVLSFNFSSGRW